MDSDNDGEEYQGNKKSRSADSESDPDDRDDDRNTYRRSDSDRKRGSSSVPLKKRRGMSRSDNAGSEEEDVGYGSDLYYDEEDREKLENMTQLEREMILSERSDKLLQAKERRELLQKNKKPEQADPFRTRGKGQDARRSAMEEIRAAQERRRKARTEQEKRRSKSYDEDDEDYAASDESEEQASEREEDDRPTRSSRPSLQREVEREPDRRQQLPPPPPRIDTTREGDEAPFDEVKLIQVRRHKLEAWQNEPFFEDKIPGCLVRLSAASSRGDSQYLVARVDAVVERTPGQYRDLGRPWSSPYQFGSGGMKTHKWLEVRRGVSARYFPMALVSNSHFTEVEWEQYVKQCHRDDAPLITTDDAKKVRKQLEEAENHQYTAQDVQKIIEAKRQKGHVSGSIAAEKARLSRLRDAAMEEGNYEEAARLEEQIADFLSKNAARTNRSSRVAISEINKKNANINFQNLLKNISNKPDGEVGSAPGGDAFSRRQTRPMTYWKTKKEDDMDDLFGDPEGGSPPHGGGQPTPPTMAKKGGARRERFDPAADPATINIDIDLTLLDLSPPVPPVAMDLLGSDWKSTLSGFAMSAAANQRNVGRLLTLTDYKRRQGIIA